MQCKHYVRYYKYFLLTFTWIVLMMGGLVDVLAVMKIKSPK
jgi:hypothetical protein